MTATVQGAARALSKRTTKYPNGHRISPFDYATGRIKCCALGGAMYCEYSRWTMATKGADKGIAFYYYCESCWNAVGPSGTSPRQRATAVTP